MGDKERLEELKRQQKAILDKAGEAKRDMDVSEKEAFDSLQREIDVLIRKLGESAADPAEKPDDSEARRRAVEAERSRSAEINALCRNFDVDAQSYIAGGNSVEEVQRDILEKLKRSGQPIHTGVHVTTDEGDKFRAAAADGMVIRGGVEIDKPADGARDFKGMSLKDLAIECMERDGQDASGMIRRSADDIYDALCRQYYNPAASFPSIMDQAINKAYVQGYNKAQVTFDLWTKKGTLKDFKAVKHEYLAGPAGDFYEVPENGEIKHDLPKDIKRPNRQLKTYGRQFTMTRQAFINDDIGFLSTIPARYAAAARRTINKQVYSILMDNGRMQDNIPIFDERHGNLLKSGTAPTQASFQNMLLKLQMMKDEFGEQINVRPAYVVVPVGYSFDMFAMFNSPTIQTPENTQASNPLYNYRTMLTIVEDATLNGLAGEGKATPWFLVGAKEDVDGIYVDYLNGDEIPKIRRMENPGTLGFVWDVYLDWGVTITDYRGIIKNPGSIITIE